MMHSVLALSLRPFATTSQQMRYNHSGAADYWNLLVFFKELFAAADQSR